MGNVQEMFFSKKSLFVKSNYKNSTVELHLLEKFLKIKTSTISNSGKTSTREKNSTKKDMDIQDSISDAISVVKENDEKSLEQKIHLFKMSKSKRFNIIDESSTNTKEKLDDITVDDELLLSINDNDDDRVVNISYSFHQEELARNFYGQAGGTSIDYLKMFYGDTGKIPPEFGQESEYFSEQVARDSDSETIQTHKAAGSFMAIQYAAMTGAQSEVNFKDRNKLDMWIKFNKDLFGMFQHSVALTQDLDYSRTG
jgi:hypothetical protein